jgi:hypothetical protein
VSLGPQSNRRDRIRNEVTDVMSAPTQPEINQWRCELDAIASAVFVIRALVLGRRGGVESIPPRPGLLCILAVCPGLGDV